jgi:hypothetical protein
VAIQFGDRCGRFLYHFSRDFSGHRTGLLEKANRADIKTTTGLAFGLSQLPKRVFFRGLTTGAIDYRLRGDILIFDYTISSEVKTRALSPAQGRLSLPAPIFPRVGEPGSFLRSYAKAEDFELWM